MIVKKYFKFVCILIVITFTGCSPSWKNIPAAPEYYPNEKVVSLKIGVELHNSEASNYYGPRVIGLLRKMMVFENIIYPYKKEDNVDAVLLLSINGGWDPKTGENMSRAIVSGLSWGLLMEESYKVEATHNVDASLKIADVEVVNYSFQENTKAEWGLGADTKEIGSELDNLQSKKIAVALANRFNNDRLLIVDNVTKSKTKVNTSLQPSVQTEIIEDNQSTTNRLQELDELHKNGILSDEDYKRAKSRLSEIQKVDELYKGGILSDEEYNKAMSRFIEKNK